MRANSQVNFANLEDPADLIKSTRCTRSTELILTKVLKIQGLRNEFSNTSTVWKISGKNVKCTELTIVACQVNVYMIQTWAVTSVKDKQTNVSWFFLSCYSQFPLIISLYAGLEISLLKMSLWLLPIQSFRHVVFSFVVVDIMYSSYMRRFWLGLCKEIWIIVNLPSYL